jgi:hypothetical protein
MELDELECVSLLSYCPRGGDAEAQRSRDIKTALKNGKLTGNPPTPITRQIATIIQRNIQLPPLLAAFGILPTLVPTPKSSLTREGDLWVPHQLAEELLGVNLGKRVAPILSRTVAIPKAASSEPANRPTAQRHFETMAVQTELASPESFLLIDDVVTRGATLLGAANRLRASYPAVPIRAFAAIRTVSNPMEFSQITSPVIEVIRVRPDGSTLRRRLNGADG